jgi:NADPH2:quinone reductase
MKALISERPGPPGTLEMGTLPDPVPGPGQIRVRVSACGINYPDVLIIDDRYQFKPDRPFAPGGEVSGTIDLIGEGVTGFAVGDRVISCIGWGGLADLAILDATLCFKIPDGVPMDEAAALLMTYGTSHHALKDRAQLKAGETLLVLGAAGGVGMAAVELGKLIGARVIGAVSSEEKAAVARERGADATVVYPRGDMDKAAARKLTDEIKAVAGGTVDVVYDGVGGTYSEAALRAISWEGRFLVVGFPAGIASIPLNLPLLKGCSIMGVFWGEFFRHSPEKNRGNVTELLGLCEAGRLKPLISARFPLERGGDAITHLASRAAVGKVVVTVD